MPHMRLAVHEQPFELMEHGGVGHVVVAPIGAAGDDDAVRRRRRSHAADLHRRGVGAQQRPRAVLPRREIEGVVHLPRRVFGRDVELGEIVVVVLDVGAHGDRESHIGEDLGYLVEDLTHRMHRAGGFGARGGGDVDGPGDEPGFEGGVRERGAAGFDGVGDFVLEGVERLPGGAAFARRQRREASHERGDAALAPQRGDARGFERFGAPGVGDGVEDLAAEPPGAFGEAVGGRRVGHRRGPSGAVSPPAPRAPRRRARRRRRRRARRCRQAPCGRGRRRRGRRRE